MTEQSENTVSTAPKLRKVGVPFKKGHDPRRNIKGRTEGSKNFLTIFAEAIKIIVKERRLPVKDPEIELVIKGIIQAFRGNYSFWKDIMDRAYGSTNSSQVNVAVQNNIQVTDEIVEQDAIEFLTERGYECTKR